MSDKKKERTVSEIQSEYSGLCARAGHAQYQISVMQKDLELINEQLRELNLEAAASSAKEAAAKAEAATPVESPAATEAPSA